MIKKCENMVCSLEENCWRHYNESDISLLPLPSEIPEDFGPILYCKLFVNKNEVKNGEHT